MIVPFHLVASASLGALVLYFKLRSEERPMIEIITYVAPKWESAWKPLSEALIFSLIGGVLSCVLLHPTTSAQAVSAGLSWTGLISGFPRGNNTNNQLHGGNGGNS